MTIYRSLGWEIAGHRHEAVLPSRALGSLPRADVKAARIRRARPGRRRRGARGDRPRPRPRPRLRPGQLGRGHHAALADPPRLVRRTADRYAYLAPDGFLAYHWHRGHDEVFVDRLVASTAETTAALWAVVASNASVADTVRAVVGPSDPLWWMLREQDANMAERESWMLRLLDAPAAIAARGFPATDLAVPLRLADDLRPANAGRWDLTVRSGRGSLTRQRTGQVHAPATPASPSGQQSGRRAGRAAGRLELGPRGLAALYAGTPVATLRRAGLAAGGSPAADAALDAAFAATPYMLDEF